eukprot:7059350-Prymnesium_polylepis.1
MDGQSDSVVCHSVAHLDHVRHDAVHLQRVLDVQAAQQAAPGEEAAWAAFVSREEAARPQDRCRLCDERSKRRGQAEYAYAVLPRPPRPPPPPYAVLPL